MSSHEGTVNTTRVVAQLTLWSGTEKLKELGDRRSHSNKPEKSFGE